MEYTSGAWSTEPETTEKTSRCSCGCGREVTLQEFKTHLGRHASNPLTRARQATKQTDPWVEVPAGGLLDLALQLEKALYMGISEECRGLAEAILEGITKSLPPNDDQSNLATSTNGGGDGGKLGLKHASLIARDHVHGRNIRKARKALLDAGHEDLAMSLTAVLRAAHLSEDDEPDEVPAPKKPRSAREIASQIAELQRYAEQYPSVA